MINQLKIRSFAVESLVKVTLYVRCSAETQLEIKPLAVDSLVGRDGGDEVQTETDAATALPPDHLRTGETVKGVPFRAAGRTIAVCEIPAVRVSGILHCLLHMGPRSPAPPLLDQDLRRHR